MSGITLRVLIQVALACAALFGLEYSLLNVLTGSDAKPDDTVNVNLFGWQMEGVKRQVEMQLRLLLMGAAFAGLFVYEALAFWKPRENLRQFRKDYLDTEKNIWREQLPADVRVNLMFARRRWYCLWLFPVFEWTWNDGFRPDHPDANMWMASWQGVCGKAFRSRAAHRAYFPIDGYRELTFKEKWLFHNEYRLWAPQLRRTRHIKGILSIPIVTKSESLSPSFRAVGVLNLDTDTDAGAEKLRSNERELAAYFTRIGKILAALRA